jgi:hypothetical protein
LEARELIERVHEADHVQQHGGLPEKLGVVTVAVLAALLALASVFGRRAVKDVLLYQERAAEAANVAESNEIKLRINEATLIDLRVYASDPDTAEAARSAIAALERDINEVYRPEQEAARQREHQLEERGERAERRYESFEVAETILQVAIVFATIATAVRSPRGLTPVAALGLIGLLLVADGYFTFLPF